MSAFHWYATEWRELPLAATAHHGRHVISHQSALLLLLRWMSSDLDFMAGRNAIGMHYFWQASQYTEIHCTLLSVYSED